MTLNDVAAFFCCIIIPGYFIFIFCQLYNNSVENLKKKTREKYERLYSDFSKKELKKIVEELETDYYSILAKYIEEAELYYFSNSASASLCCEKFPIYGHDKMCELRVIKYCENIMAYSRRYMDLYYSYAVAAKLCGMRIFSETELGCDIK